MKRLWISAAALLLLPLFLTTAQAQDLNWLHREIQMLTAPDMAGRGYLHQAQQRASKHIASVFQKAGLQSILPDSGFRQDFSFPVVTFPDSMTLRIDGRRLRPGLDFLVDASSDSYEARRQKLKVAEVGKLASREEWEALRQTLRPGKIWLLRGTDSLAHLLNIRLRHLPELLPPGAFILPVSGKMTWTVSTNLNKGRTVLFVQDSVLPLHPHRADLIVHSRLDTATPCANVMAVQRGTAVPDSFIVFTAHYDHLGMMGTEAMFPGASDNASGTACLEWLATYFARHPQRYSILFIAFSGEEAGLLGSTYFVQHPAVSLSKIRFLINLDIMGNAQDGVTVVNATGHPTEFARLQSLNKKKNYLPQIRSRGNAANSDHYPFSEKGIPAFFLYSNGGPGFYHDVFDKAETLSLTHVDGVLSLLIDFVRTLQ